MILFLFFLSGFVESYAILSNPLPNHILKPGEEFEYVIPDGTFTSSFNTTMYYQIESPNNWIKREFGSESLRSGFYFFRPTRIEVVGDYCFCADKHFGLRIFDITDLENIELISELLLPGDFNGIFVESNYAFLASGKDGLHIIDVSNKKSVELVTTYEIPGTSNGVFAKDKYVYVVGSYGLRVVDISTISNPQTTSVVETGSSSFDVIVTEDDLAIISESQDGIRFINVTEKDHPEEISVYDEHEVDYFTYVNYPELGKKYVIYNVYQSTTNILDITNPSSIVHVSSVDNNCFGGVKVNKDLGLVYIAASNGLNILNISNISSPFLSGSKSFDRVFRDLDLIDFTNNSVILSTEDDGLLIVNISLDSSSGSHNVQDISEFEFVSYNGNPSGVLLHGRYVYLTNSYCLIVFDVSDKSQPILQNSLCDGILAASRMDFVDNDHILVGGKNLYSINVGDKQNPPALLSTFSTTGDVISNVVVDGDIAFLAENTQGKVEIVDISDLGIMVHLSYVVFTEVGSVAFDLDVLEIDDDKILYTGIGMKGLAIANVTDPRSPELLGEYPSFRTFSLYLPKKRSYGFQNSVILYTCGPNIFRIINVTNHSNPFEISSYTYPGFTGCDFVIQALAVDEENHLAYFGCGIQHILVVLDISDIFNPQLHTTIVTAGSRHMHLDISPDGGYIYASTAGGLEVFGSNQLVLFDNIEESFSCGNITVRVEATDITNSSLVASTSFYIYRMFNSSDASSLCGGMGDCVDYVDCDCFQGWDGDKCEYPFCFNASEFSGGSVCTEHGNCINPDSCFCDLSLEQVWYGPRCQYHFCFGIGETNVSHVCGKGHGTCVESDRCLCHQGYSSQIPFGECTVWYCNEIGYSEKTVCSGRGTCIDHNTCICRNEFKGEDCETWSCDGIDHNDFRRSCNGRGECKSPDDCECRSSYIGRTCQTNTLYFTVMTPILTLTSICVMVFVMIVIFIACSLCCACVLALIFSLFSLIGVVTKQTKTVKRFSQLKNFDLLLQEQELEEDTSIAHLKIDMSIFEIDFEDIRLTKILGEGGSSSVVYKALWKNKIVAFKCFKTRSVCSNQFSFDEFEREVSILGSVRHPNILQFFGCSLKPPRVGILMEFCENGDLCFYIRKMGKEYIKFSEKLRMIYEIILPMIYLHSKNIIHRDLKLENVLLDNTNSCKLMDFGLSKIVDRMSEVKTKSIGTSYYMAPELFSEKYDEKIDVFAFGICLYMIMTEEFHPYGVDYTMSIEMRVAQDPEFRPKLEKLESVESIPEGNIKWLSKMIQSCWDDNPINRLSFAELGEIVGKKITKEKAESISEFEYEKKNIETSNDRQSDNYNSSIIEDKGEKSVDEYKNQIMLLLDEVKSLKSEMERVEKENKTLRRKLDGKGCDGEYNEERGDDSSSSDDISSVGESD